MTRPNYGERVAARLVTTKACPNSDIYGIYVDEAFVGFALDKGLLEARATSLRIIIAREIEAARKDARAKLRYSQWRKEQGIGQKRRRIRDSAAFMKESPHGS